MVKAGQSRPQPLVSAQRREHVDSGAGEAEGTRERILDIALELFTEHGYDKTSLRQIADRLGHSKAAIYYYFASKEDILMALHMRFHEFGQEALENIRADEMTAEVFAGLLSRLVDAMLVHRPLLLLHERNPAAFEALHTEDHSASHKDLQERFRETLLNESLPVTTRLRMSCAFGAIMGGLVIGGDVFSEVPSEQIGEVLRSVVADLLLRDVENEETRA